MFVFICCTKIIDIYLNLWLNSNIKNFKFVKIK